MSRTKALEKVKLTRFDDLFGGKEEPVVEAGEVKQIPISELHEFHNHPFQIRSNDRKRTSAWCVGAGNCTITKRRRL